MELKLAKQRDRELWDHLVSISVNGTIFHMWDWIEVLQKHTGLKLVRLLFHKDNNFFSLFPVYVKMGVTKKAVSPPPVCNNSYMGPAFILDLGMKLSKKTKILVEIMEEVDKFIFENYNCINFKIQISPGIYDMRPLKWLGYSVEPNFTYKINIGDLSRVWENLPHKTRAKIKKCYNKNVEIVQGDRDEFDALLRLVFPRIGERYQKECKSFIEEIFKKFFPKNLKIFSVRLDGEIISGVVALVYKNFIYFWVGTPKTEIKGLYPNELLLWEVIKWACENNLQFCENICHGDQRLSHFKSNFNPELEIWFSAMKYKNKIAKIGSELLGLFKR